MFNNLIFKVMFSSLISAIETLRDIDIEKLENLSSIIEDVAEKLGDIDNQLYSLANDIEEAKQLLEDLDMED